MLTSDAQIEGYNEEKKYLSRGSWMVVQVFDLEHHQ